MHINRRLAIDDKVPYAIVPFLFSSQFYSFFSKTAAEMSIQVLWTSHSINFNLPINVLPQALCPLSMFSLAYSAVLFSVACGSRRIVESNSRPFFVNLPISMKSVLQKGAEIFPLKDSWGQFILLRL